MSGKQPTAKPAATEAGEASRFEDVALIHGRTPDGEGFSIIRKRGDRLELGAVKPLKDGVPISGEVVTLRPRPEFPLLCDVEVAYRPAHHGDDVAEKPRGPRRGPAQVATESYRQNWDAIFQRSAKKPELAN